MLSEKAKTLIDKEVQAIVSDNMDAIRDGLLFGANEDMTHEQLQCLMLENSIKLSTSLSIQIVVDLLESNGLLDVADDKLLQKHLLSLVK